MKWIPIEKAKVKFKCNYLIASSDADPSVGKLKESKITADGVVHTFTTHAADDVIGTHIANLTDPSAPSKD